MQIAGLITLLALGPQAPAPPPPSVFSTAVELVAVDVAVVDENGRPVADLQAADFELKVKDRPRRVVNAEFLASATDEAAAEEERPPAQRQPFASNAQARSARLVLIVVDTGNIEMGRGREAVEAAATLLDRLGRDDRVGLLTLPTGGPREEFTADHDRIRAALKQVVGRARLTSRWLSNQEMLACGNSSPIDNEICGAALDRVCGADSDCRARVVEEAWQLSMELNHRASRSVSSLLSAFKALGRVDARKIVVLVSQGLNLPNQESHGVTGPEIQSLIDAAAAARVAFYVVPVDPGSDLPPVDSDVPAHEVSIDRIAHRWNLESLAVGSGGTVLRGAPSVAFARVARETSAYYRLGFEPEDDDRDGKHKGLRVRVRRPGLSVRASTVFVDSTARKPEELKAALLAALESPVPSAALPVRLGAFSLVAPEAGKVRLLVAAEVLGGFEASRLSVGYVLLDPRGKVVASAKQELKGALDGRGGVPYSTSLVVPEGEYELRLAFCDGRGRIGGVVHHLTAGLSGVGGVAVGDLLMGPVPAQGVGFRPSVEPQLSGTLLAHCEIAARERAELEGAAAEIVVSTTAGQPVATVPARLSRPGESDRVAVQAGLRTDSLPPGWYEARLRLTLASGRRAEVVRPFEIR